MVRSPARSLILLGVGIGVVALIASCSDTSGPKLNVARVEVNLSPTLLVGTSAVATARAFDLNGVELTGFTPNWRSSATNIVTIDKQGILTGKSLGSATITATVGGVSGTAVLTVVPVPVSAILIQPATTTVDRGQTLALRATLLDQFGDTLTNRVVTWVSDAPGIASVSGSGVVTAVAAGNATVTATSEGITGSAAINVIVTPVVGGPAITSITPSLLVPGGTVTIDGANFNANAVFDEVRIAGVLAPVMSASATEIVAVVPSAGFGCQPTRNVYVQVAVGSVADAKLQMLQSVGQRALQPGESAILSNASDARCFELPQTSGHYLLTVYNAKTAVTADTSFQLHGAKGLLPPGTVAPLPRSLRSGALATRSVSPRAAPANLGLVLHEAQVREEADAHARLLEANIAMVRRAGSPLAGLAASRAAARAAVTADQTVGSTVSLKIPNVGGFLNGGTDFCHDNFAVTGRVVYNGTRSIVVEDVTAPLAGQMDTLFAKVGQEFDNVMYDIDKTNFGDPLRLDAQLDNNGKIIMLFSPKVNTFTSIAGFVVTCDFYSVQTYPSSNHAEMFYARVPTDARSGFFDPATNNPIDSRDQWYRTIRSTVVHEVKHIASFSNRIADFQTSLEEAWLEEGTARHAEEIWARNATYNGLLQGGNATYDATIRCDVLRITPLPDCTGKPLAMLRHLGVSGLHDYLRDNELRSPLGPKVGYADGSFYGSAWSLVRWVLDNHAVDEPTFLGSIVRTNLSGVNNLTAHLGRSWEDILGEWSLSLYMDDYPGFVSANPRVQFPSWNLRSIYAGLNQDDPQNYPFAFPLLPRPVSYGDFNVVVPKLAGGSFAAFLLTGSLQSRQLLQLQNVFGGDPASSLRVAIVRID